MDVLRTLLPLLWVLSTSPKEHHYFVDPRSGLDAEGRGTAEAPWRSLTFALKKIERPSEESPCVLSLAAGTYSSNSGEVFPLELAPNISLMGESSGAAIFAGSNVPVVLKLKSSGNRGPIRISSVSLQDAQTGIELEPQSDLLLILRDVSFERCRRGLHLPLSVEASPPREAPQIDISDCRFTKNGYGILLGGESWNQVAHVRSLRLEGCSFEDCESDGVQFHALPPELDQGTALRVEKCVFARCEVGLHIPRPSGDAILEVRGNRFLSNSLFGLRCSGNSGNPQHRSFIADNYFDGNGVGLHVTNCQVTCDVRRNDIRSSIGNGIFYANYAPTPTLAIFADNIIAKNGADGLYALSDGQNLRVVVVNNTIALNGVMGIRRHDKHGGKSQFLIFNCILWKNSRGDLHNILPDEVSHCDVASPDFAGKNGNISSDPLFVDLSKFDLRLRPESPCIDGGKEALEEMSPERDFHSRPRIVPGKEGSPPKIDIGACEFSSSPKDAR